MTDRPSISDVAQAYLSAGLCVLSAIRAEKRPAVGRWKQYQKRLPTPAELSAWMANNPDAVCILCGAASNNAEIIDFDGGGELFSAWWDRIPAELRERLVVERTPSGGWHVIYCCITAVCGNMKLAQRRVDEKVVTQIETRGEGGLFLCAPTAGYEITQGDPCDLPVLTEAERDVLLQAAWDLNECPPHSANVGQRSALSVGQGELSADNSNNGDGPSDNGHGRPMSVDISHICGLSADDADIRRGASHNAHITPMSADPSHSRPMFRCQHCGATMTGECIRRKQMDGSVKFHTYYRCANNHPPARHPRNRWREADVEQPVVRYLTRLRMPTPELRDWLLGVLRQATGQLHGEQITQLRSLKRRGIELSKQRDRLMTLYLEGDVDTPMFQEMKDSLQSQSDEVESALARLDGDGRVGPSIADRAFEFTQDPAEGWERLPMSGKQRILRTVSTQRTLSRKRVRIKLRKPFSLVSHSHHANPPRERQEERQRWILEQLHSGVQLTREMVEVEFDIGARQAKRVLGPLVSGGMIAFVRGPRPGHYELQAKIDVG